MQTSVYGLPLSSAKWASLLSQNKHPCQVPTPWWLQKRSCKREKREGAHTGWLWNTEHPTSTHCQGLSLFSICNFRVSSSVFDGPVYLYFSSIGIIWYWTDPNNKIWQEKLPSCSLVSEATSKPMFLSSSILMIPLFWDQQVSSLF